MGGVTRPHHMAASSGLLSARNIADILFTPVCPLCCIPSTWPHFLCANFCFRGQEFAKEVLAEGPVPHLLSEEPSVSH